MLGVKFLTNNKLSRGLLYVRELVHETKLRYVTLVLPLLSLLGLISSWLFLLLPIIIMMIFGNIRHYNEFFFDTYALLMDSIFDWESKDGLINSEEFIARLERGDFYRKLNCGISSHLQDFLLVDPLLTPGVLAVGGMGSGKTVTGVGISSIGLASSSLCSVYFIVDISEKGAGDYKKLFKYKSNVATALYDPQKLVPLIFMLYEELMARGKRFQDMNNASNAYEYEEFYRELAKRYKDVIYEKILSSSPLSSEEKDLLRNIASKDLLIMGTDFNVAISKIADGEINSQTTKDALYTKKFQGVALINIVFEEFSRIINSPQLNYFENFSTEGTIAKMLFDIMRTSRSALFSSVILTQRATYNEVPNDIKQGLGTTLCHSLNSPSDAQIVNLPHATEVRKGMKGRSATEEGFIQYPYFPGRSMDNLLEKYYKPLEGEMFAYQMEDYHKALSGSGSDGMCDTAKLKFVIQNFNMFKPLRIVSRFLPLFGFSIIDRDLTSTEISGVAEKDGEIYGILIIAPAGKGNSMTGSSKKVENFIKELKLIGSTKYLIFNFSKNSVQAPRDAEGISMDFEEMVKMGDILDNQNITKVLGTFDSLHAEIPLAKGGLKSTPRKTGKTNFTDDSDFSEMFGD